MPMWLPPTAQEQPEVSLVSWGAFEVLIPELGAPTIHVAGMLETGAHARVTSPVVKVDAALRSVVTSTGRVYRLLGAPGMRGDAEYVFESWLRNWSATVLNDAAPAMARAFEAGELTVNKDSGRSPGS